jgi:O-antigen ligase
MAEPAAERIFSPVAVIAIVLFALIPLGSATFFATSVVQFTLALLFLATVGRYAIRNDPAQAAQALLKGVPPGALLALPALAIIQTSAQFAIGFSTGPTLAMTQATMTTIVLVAFYLLCRGAAISRRDIQILLLGLVAIGTAEALYGLLNLLSGNEYLLIYKRKIFPHSATGTLTGRSHFAYLMEMTAPIALALLATQARRTRIYGATDSTGRTIAAATAAVTILLALIFSRSRMGIMAISGAAGIVMLLSRKLAPATLEDTRSEKRSRNFVVGIALIAVLGFGVLIGLEAVIDRFGNLEHDFQASRRHAWLATFRMFLDAPVVGHGWGTFRELVVGYQPRPTGNFFPHAHNEYLQVMAEGGLVGLGIVGYLLVLYVRRLVSTLSRQLDYQQRAITVALAVSTTSVLFHSVADFGLRIPGIALTFMVALALFVRVTESPQLIAETVDSNLKRRRRRSKRRRAE